MLWSIGATLARHDNTMEGGPRGVFSMPLPRIDALFGVTLSSGLYVILLHKK